MSCKECGNRTRVVARFCAGDPKADLRAAHAAQVERERTGDPVHVHYERLGDQFIVVRAA